MVSLGDAARQLALAQGRSRLVIGEGTITEQKSGFFASFSSASKATNRTQIQRFKEILAADTRLQRAPGATEAAFKALGDALKEGRPLTARLMAKAYVDGDLAAGRYERRQMTAKEEFKTRAIAFVRANDLVDLAVRHATGGTVQRLSKALPPDAMRAVQGLVIEEMRQAIEAESAKGTLGPPRLPTIEAMIGAAVTSRLEAIQAIAANPAGKLKEEGQILSGRMVAVLDTVRAFGARRTEARLLSSAGANEMFEQRVLKDLSKRVGGLGNAALLDLYRATLSTEMLELRLALANRQGDPRADDLLRDLNSFEGMVHGEIAERSLERAVRTAGGKHEPLLTGTQTATLADVERRVMKKELVEQTDAFLTGDGSAAFSHDPKSVRALEGRGVALDQVGKVLREAEVTINLPGWLFQPEGPFVAKDGRLKGDEARLKNVFEVPESKGPAYVERRQVIEQAQLPTLARQDAQGLDPQGHPISAALNFGRNLLGAAYKGGYGDLVVVLKEGVKQRCTYTPKDTFYSFEARLTPERVAAMKTGLAQLFQNPKGGLSEQALEANGQDHKLLARLFERLNGAVGRAFGIGHPLDLDDFVYKELTAGLEDNGGLRREDIDRLFGLALKTLVDTSDEANRVTSTERLARVLGDLANKPGEKDDMVGAATTAARDGRRVNLGLQDYVEVQVFGGVDLLRDVQEIQYDRRVLASHPGALAGLLQLAKPPHNITLREVNREALVSVTRLDTDETLQVSFSTLSEADKQKMVPGLGEFRKQYLPELLQPYQQHEQTFDPTGIHGRHHVGRALIYSNVLANVLRERGAVVNSDVLYSTVALHDAGRQGNGPDRWEGDSARLAQAFYQQRGIGDDRFRTRLGACIDSRAKGPVKSLEGAILKSADSLDIMRLTGREGYNPDLLWFMNRDARLPEGGYVEADKDLRDALIGEIAAFIEATEPLTEGDRRLTKALDELNRSEAARAMKLAELEQQGVRNPAGRSEIRELDLRQEQLAKEVREAGEQRRTEHMKLNAGLSGEQIFAALEDELLANKAKYPTLARFYDPTR